MHAKEPLELPNPPSNEQHSHVARHTTAIQPESSNRKRKSAPRVVFMREAKSIFDCRERECDERETNAICINEELLSSRGTEQAKASLIMECSKTRRFGPRRYRGGRRVVRCSNQYATECSCAVAPTWMERNQSNSTI
jgi:hypothetical protein